MTVAASAQVVRFDRRDAVTDKREPMLVAPSPDGRADLIVGCDGYALRSMELAQFLWPRLDLLVRFDQAPPLRAVGVLKHPDGLEIRPNDRGGFAKALPTASRLVVRLDKGQPLDFIFDWTVDNKYAFGAAAETVGAQRMPATLGYDFLTQGLARAAAGQYATLASLLAAAKVEWHKDGRPLETGQVIGPIMTAMANTKDKRTREDAGQVLFGPVWPTLRPLVEAPGGYRLLSQPMDRQLVWLRTSCPT